MLVEAREGEGEGKRESQPAILISGSLLSCSEKGQRSGFLLQDKVTIENNNVLYFSRSQKNIFRKFSLQVSH